MKSSAIVTGIGMMVLIAGAARAADPVTTFKFAFGEKPAAGFTAVKPTDIYKKGEKNFGFEPGVTLKPGALSMTSDKAYYFSVAVPEGNYRVTVTAGDPAGPTDLTMKAELRRLMVEDFHLDAGKTDKTSFIVNVRTPIYPGGKVGLKAPRETTEEAWAWDEKLTLEINGAHPNVNSIEIEKVDVPTIFLDGDSTMCDQSQEPWNSWGQMFPRFFKDDIAVSNHAESGETVAGSLGAHRFDKIWSVMKKGDYLFFAFGHNDMKDTKANALDTYTADYKKIIETTRAKGGIPVVVSSMERKAGITTNTLKGYPDAAKQVADDEKAIFIDLHAMSQVLYKGLGSDMNAAFQDGTHNNNFGSYEISQLIIKGIRDSQADEMKALLPHIKSDVKVFDPSKPDKAAAYKVPVSPNFSTAAPLGN